MKGGIISKELPGFPKTDAWLPSHIEGPVDVMGIAFSLTHFHVPFFENTHICYRYKPIYINI